MHLKVHVLHLWLLLLITFSVSLSSYPPRTAYMDSCLAEWDRDKAISTPLDEEVIFDMTCYNEEGHLEDKHYFHVMINCLIPLSPTLALAANTSAADGHVKRRINIYTNSESLRHWLRFLLPHFHVETSLYLMTGFERKHLLRQPLIDTHHYHHKSEYLSCVWFLRDLGMVSVKEFPRGGSNSISSSVINVLFIHRSGSSRDIQNLKELEKHFAFSRFNYSMVTFKGNESARDTFLQFAYADVVVGYHGAGFSNTIFCKPSTMIIELSMWVYGDDYCLPGDRNPKYAIWRNNQDLINTAFVDWRTVYVPFNRSGLVEDELQTYVQQMTETDRDADHFLKSCGVYLLPEDVKVIHDMIEGRFSTEIASDKRRGEIITGSVKTILLGAGDNVDYGHCYSYHLARDKHKQYFGIL